jgi:peptide deformylase
MILPIYLHGQPVLRKEAEEVPTDYPELKQLIDDMFETMYAADGVGLAAPQIGRSLRLFVIDATPWAEDDPAMADMKKVFVNAEIYERSEKTVGMEEGCLSFPKIHEMVERPETIRIRYRDENGVARDEEFTGKAARVIQHEYDHIEGKVFVDRISPLRRTLIRSKLNAFERGRYSASYKCKPVK